MKNSHDILKEIERRVNEAADRCAHLRALDENPMQDASPNQKWLVAHERTKQLGRLEALSDLLTWVNERTRRWWELCGYPDV